jgi:hypothetical protein
MVAFWYYAFGNVLVRRGDRSTKSNMSSHGFIGGTEESVRGPGGDD